MAQPMFSAVYIHSPVVEVPSQHLLSEVGVTPSYNEGVCASDAAPLPSYIVSYGKRVRMVGPGTFDVCDSGASWIRVTLAGTASALVRMGTYVRGVAGPSVCTVVGESQTGGPSSRPIAHPAVAHAVPDCGLCARSMVSKLCAEFYKLHWVTGTGGSIAIRHGERIFMAPSGVQKERIKPEDVFALDTAGTPIYTPVAKPPRPPLKLSQCAPLFHQAFTLRKAGACIHTHSIDAMMVTLRVGSEFRITHQEMIKGIKGHGFVDTLVVPVIENTPHERDLADSLAAAIKAYPASCAVLVRRHGVYVWGNTWESAKTQAECYHYLFQAALRMWDAGLDPAAAPPGAESAPTSSAAKRRRGVPCATNGTCCVARAGAGAGIGAGPVTTPAAPADAKPETPEERVKALASMKALPPVDMDAVSVVLLDIEGTTTPISFVTDTLFPYAAANAESHLAATWDTEETRGDVAALLAQSQADVAAGMDGVVAIDLSGDKAVQVQSVVSNVAWQMKLNRKTGALKQFQGHIWRAGYASGKLRGHLFPDSQPFMAASVAASRRVCIYSSGSREAQRLLFQYSEAGDLLPLISCYFDTTSGAKVEPESYTNIGLSLGVESLRSVLFFTDAVKEAAAAHSAGAQVVLMTRPGNAPLPPHPFATQSAFTV